MKYNESHVCPQKVRIRHMYLLSDQNRTSVNNWQLSSVVSMEHVNIATAIVL